jgi:hypothetical protein
MATIPTPRESALKILSRFKDFNIRPGETLGGNNLESYEKYGLKFEDYKRGMAYAIEQGWIVYTRNNDYRLTDSGFAEM